MKRLKKQTKLAAAHRGNGAAPKDKALRIDPASIPQLILERKGLIVDCIEEISRLQKVAKQAQLEIGQLKQLAAQPTTDDPPPAATDQGEAAP